MNSDRLKPYKPKGRYSYRIAFFTKRKKRTLYSVYVIRALQRLGCTVKHVNVYNYNRWFGTRLADWIIRRRVERFGPDAVFVFSSDIINQTLEHLATRYRTAHLLDEVFTVDSPVAEKMKLVDVSFQTQRGHLEESRKAGVKNPMYVPSGVDQDFHRSVPSDNAFESDVAFIGKGYFKTRVDLIEAVDQKFSLKVYGQRWEKTAIAPARNEIGVADFRRVCSSARIILGIDKATELELYFSNRTWFVLGCGGFLLTRYVNGLEQLFANHEQLVWFKDIEECCELIRFYLTHEDLRKKIAKTGQTFAHEVYPNERMAEFMLRSLFEGETLEPLTDPGPGFESGEAAYGSFMNSVA